MSNTRKLIALITFLILASLGFSIHSQASAQKKLEARNAIKERQAAFILIQRNFKAITESIAGKNSVSPQALQEFAGNLHFLSTMAAHMFNPENQIEGVNSKATNAVWEKHNDFQKAMKSYLLDTEILSNNIHNMDDKELRQAVSVLGEHCKSCHKKYKTR